MKTSHGIVVAAALLCGTAAFLQSTQAQEPRLQVPKLNPPKLAAVRNYEVYTFEGKTLRIDANTGQVDWLFYPQGDWFWRADEEGGTKPLPGTNRYVLFKDSKIKEILRMDKQTGRTWKQGVNITGAPVWQDFIAK